jgi:hypothetical protein
VPRRRTLKVELRPVIQVEKHYLRLLKTRKKVVYFIRGDKKYKYLWGRSRVLYIGQTRRTGRRPFESLGWKAPELLRLYGMKKLEIVYVEAPPRKRVNILKKLENIFLYEFRREFGEVPKANTQGRKRVRLTDEGDYFKSSTVRNKILQLSQ